MQIDVGFVFTPYVPAIDVLAGKRIPIGCGHCDEIENPEGSAGIESVLIIAIGNKKKRRGHYGEPNDCENKLQDAF
jgi:hypothetical protein